MIDDQFKSVDGRMVCGCGSSAAYVSGIGWYCKRGWDCDWPDLISPSKSDKTRIAELEAELAALHKVQS